MNESNTEPCTNCCGAGYFGINTDCRCCGGTGRVPKRDGTTGPRFLGLEALERHIEEVTEDMLPARPSALEDAFNDDKTEIINDALRALRTGAEP